MSDYSAQGLGFNKFWAGTLSLQAGWHTFMSFGIGYPTSWVELLSHAPYSMQQPLSSSFTMSCPHLLHWLPVSMLKTIVVGMQHISGRNRNSRARALPIGNKKTEFFSVVSWVLIINVMFRFRKLFLVWNRDLRV